MQTSGHPISGHKTSPHQPLHTTLQAALCKVAGDGDGNQRQRGAGYKGKGKGGAGDEALAEAVGATIQGVCACGCVCERAHMHKRARACAVWSSAHIQTHTHTHAHTNTNRIPPPTTRSSRESRDPRAIPARARSYWLPSLHAGLRNVLIGSEADLPGMCNQPRARAYTCTHAHTHMCTFTFMHTRTLAHM